MHIIEKYLSMLNTYGKVDGCHAIHDNKNIGIGQFFKAIIDTN
jgi:hypothetical protein